MAGVGIRVVSDMDRSLQGVLSSKTAPETEAATSVTGVTAEAIMPET